MMYLMPQMRQIKRIFGKIAFDTPKPSEYIQRMVSIATDENDIVMDFFSGSSTTADSVLKINHKDGKHRHFVMV